MCVHVCVRMHAYMHGTPPTHPYLPPPPSTHLPPPRGVEPRNHLKFDNTSTYQDISIPFEDLKSVKNSPPMGGCGCVGGWVGQWVGSRQMTNNLINLDLIVIIQFCLKIYDLYRHPHPWVGVWVIGWVSGSMGGSMGGLRSND